MPPLDQVAARGHAVLCRGKKRGRPVTIHDRIAGHETVIAPMRRAKQGIRRTRMRRTVGAGLLLERGEQGGGIHAIPPTLQQSLSARLDRLGPAREVAQIGAVIGRGFSYSLLRAIAEMADAPLQAALERLAEADILLVQGLPPDSDYRFKHTLMQDAAYENLLKSRRQVLHRRVAEALRDCVGTAAVEPELLAHHFTQAGLTEAAIDWWGKAGQRSLERSSNLEAAAFFGNALDALGRLPANRRTRELAVDLRFNLRSALMPLGDFARTLEILREAEVVAEELNDTRRLGRIAASMTNVFWEMGDQDRAIRSGRRALEIAAGVEDSALRDMALRYLGCSYYAIGDYLPPCVAWWNTRSGHSG